MDERQRLSGETVSLRGNEILPLTEPGACWRVESGSLGLFAVPLERGVAVGPRRFFFGAGPGEALFAVGPVPDGQPAIVAVALEDCRLLRLPLDGGAGAGGAGDERVVAWQANWRAAVGDLPDADPAGRPITLDAFHRALLERVHEIGRSEDREECERFEARQRRSREMTRQAVSELTSVLAPGESVIPPGSELFLAAYVVGQASGVRLRRPAGWREDDARSDPVDLIAAASQVRSRKVLLHDGWMRQDCGPLLAFTAGERKPLALLPLAPGKYEVFDPSTRARGPLVAAIVERLDPQAHVFYRPLPEEATSGVELTRFALRGRGRDLSILLATAAAATLLGMFTPQATALLVDYAIPDADRGLLAQLGLGLAAAAFGAAAFRFTQGIAMMRVETGADVATQSAVWDRLLGLQLAFFRRFSTGDLLSRVTAISQIRAYLSGTTLRTLFSSVVALLNLGLLLYYSPRLTLVALGVALLSGGLTVGSGFMILRCYRQILELKGRFFGLLVQLINGVAKLRVAAAEERAFGQWARAYAQLARLELRQRLIQDNVRVANVALSTVSAIGLFAIAASLVGDGGSGSALTTGVFLAFNVAFGTFIGAIVGLSNTITDIMAIAILRERAKPILSQAPEVNERKADPGRLAGRLDVDHVVFQYRKEGPIILDGVELRAAPGEFIALVGPSGSGKSTLFRLLLGFESPLSGNIFYDGQDLTGLDVHSIRRQMGVVLQNGRINAGSLFENIVCGTQVTLNDAWEAARATGFADEIAAMPMGMHTMVSEGGTNLSGGQRQRLLLSRALVHKPRLLLLDEATSALDNETQTVVSESLEALEVTRIVIAHRLSTIRRADRIYVVDGGRIVQQGNFEELTAQPGLFARLMARQMA
jgi:ATP-binding cassette subfamily C protein